jgi:hypothetical protein
LDQSGTCSGSNRQNLFRPILPQLKGNSANDNAPVFGACIPCDLNQRARHFGKGAALHWRKRLPGSTVTAMLWPGANRQGTEDLRLGRLLQINPLFHGFIMPCSLISSSNCSKGMTLSRMS